MRYPEVMSRWSTFSIPAFAMRRWRKRSRRCSFAVRIPLLLQEHTAFRRLINIVPRSGRIIAGIDSPVVKELIPSAFSRVATSGIGTGEWQAAKIETKLDGMVFDVLRAELQVGRFMIPLPGTFNVQ